MNLFSLLKTKLSPAPLLSPSECAARVLSGEALLVDVREPGEWASGVAESARLLPLSDLTGTRSQWGPFLAESGGREIVLYCAVGGRAGVAARILASEGFRAHNTGGLRDWIASGWPVVKDLGSPPNPPFSPSQTPAFQPKGRTMKANIGSIDRVIRIVAGLCILGAGYYFKSWWGLVGLLPIVTAAFRFCPAYVPFGLSTCPRQDK